MDGSDVASPRGSRVRYDAERDTWLVHRPARQWPIPVPARSWPIPAPPEIADPDRGSGWSTALPMLGSLGIVGFAVVARSLVYVVVAGLMVVAVVGGTIATMSVARRRERHRRIRVRRDYAARVAEAEHHSWRAAVVQRDALADLYPDTAGLLDAVRRYGALWERRPSDADFGHVRLGLGRVRASGPVMMDDAAGAVGGVQEDDLAALAADAVASTAWLDEVPVVLPLRTLGAVAVVGDLDRGRALAGAWLASLTATCAPTDLRVVGLVPPDAAGVWDWCKWLPHTRDPLAGDGFGRAARAVTTDRLAFAADLTALASVRVDQVRVAREMQGWTHGSTAVAAEHVVVLIDDYTPETFAEIGPTLDVLLTRGAELAVTVLLLVRDENVAPSSHGARVDLLAEGRARYREAGLDGRLEENVLADAVDPVAAEALARAMSPLQLADVDANADLVDTVRLVELLGYDSADALDPRTDWLRPAAFLDQQAEMPDEAMSQEARSGPGADDLLRTPIGIRSDGSHLVLDLKQAADGGMGPHGMLVGATGSGKSELLRSLVAGLAAGHDPSLLNVLLVDFKGGAAFADLGGLPHTTGLITNLADDLSLVDRMRLSLTGELDRRQQLLRDAGNLDSIGDYLLQRAQRPELPDLPYLLVVVDEFGELLSVRPEFIETFVTIGRLGRSLGVHLLLATQRLEEGRIRGLESHLRYRICLRTYSGPESTTVIGVPDAHTLPSLPGLGYLRVDADLVRFKAATTSLPHRPTSRHQRAPAEIVPFAIGSATRGDSADVALAAPAAETELRVLVRRLVGDGSSPVQRPVWLPPLPAAVSLAEVADRMSGQRELLRVAVGLVDDPIRQAQDALMLDLSGSRGHLACVGSPRTGKTTFLRTLVEALVTDVSPAEVAVYVLDLGGGGLNDLSELPHVGAVAGRHDPDAVARLVREMRAVVDERSAAFRACGVASLTELRNHPRVDQVLPDPLAADVFLLVDNLGVLRQEFTELDLALSDLAATSLQFGVHVVVTANRWLDVRPALLDAIGNRLELRLNEPVDSLAGRAKAEAVAVDRPGRGLLRDGRQVQLALPTGEPVPPPPGGPLAPRVLPLPARLAVGDVPALAAAAGRPVAASRGLVLGVGEFRLTPELIDLTAPGAHLVVYGDEGSGRTTLLRRVVEHLATTTSPYEVRIHLVDIARGLLDLADLAAVDDYAFTTSLTQQMAEGLFAELYDRLPPSTVDRQSLLLRDWWSGPEHVLVVDDYDLTLSGVQGPLSPLSETLAHARDIGLHVVLARRVAGSSRSSYEPFGQRLRELTPMALLMDGERSEGPLIGERAARRLPPGRGLLVRRGSPDTLVQLALPDLVVP